MNVLANDGISVEGVEKLNQAGFNVTTEPISQEEIVEAYKHLEKKRTKGKIIVVLN